MNIGPDFFLEVLCLGIYSRTDDSKRVVQAALEMYKEDISKDSIMNDNMSRLYMGILEEIIVSEADLSNDAEAATLLLKFKHSDEIKKHPTILQEIGEIIKHRNEVSTRRVTFMEKKVSNWIIWTKNNMAIKKMFSKSQQCTRTIDHASQDEFLSGILTEARNLVSSHETIITQQNSTIDFINLADKASIRAGLEAFQNKREVDAWYSGLQGVNRMYGKHGGAARGEFIAFGAQSYNYKSGMLMDWARWIARLNKPKPCPGKRPAIVFVSLENEAFENMSEWFKAVYRNMFKKNPGELSDDEIIDFVQKEFSIHGWELLIYREMGDYFGYEQWVNLHNELSKQGYDVQASFLDYIGLMKKPDEAGNAADNLQLLFNRIGNYANHQQMTVFTGIQLNRKAAEMSAAGQCNPVKLYNADCIAGSTGIMRELDVLDFLHCEVNAMGYKFLTIQRFKHKYVHDTPLEDWYCAYRFTPFGIMDDVNGKDMSVKDIWSDSELAPTGTDGALY